MVRALCLLLLPMGHGEEEGGLLQVGNKKVLSHQVGPPGESLSEAASRAAQKQQQLALLVERISQLETAVGERVHGKPHDCKSGKCKTVKASTFDETVVKTALDSNMLVIGELSQEHEEQQLLIDQSNNGIVSCNAQLDKNFDGVEGVNLLKIQMEHKRKAHESCRLQQVGYTTERDTACEEYYRYADVTQASHPPCLCDDATGKPSQNAEQYSSYSTEALTEADAITDCYQQKKAWVKKYQVLVEKQSLCKNSATTCQYEVDKCAKFQVDFEEAYCAYGSKLQETCRDFASCLSPADCKPLVQQRVDLIANLKLWENTQKEVFKAVKTMDCLMSLMSPGYAPPSLDDLSNCQNLVVDTSHLDLTYPYNVDEPKSCDDSQVTNLPGQVAWKEAEYSDPSWGGYVQTVKSCEATPPTAPPVAVEGWRIKAKTTNSEWTWDVKRLKFIVDGAELEVGPCRAVDSGVEWSHAAENAFKEGPIWGGRQRNNELYLGLECPTSPFVEVRMNQGCGHSADVVTIQKKVAGTWLDVGSSDHTKCDQEVTLFKN